MYKSERSKACDITPAVKSAVWWRDRGRCILCGNKAAMPNAHFISRAEGGLGVEENIVTLCLECHDEYDHTAKKSVIREEIRQYLKRSYGEKWSEENLRYKH